MKGKDLIKTAIKLAPIVLPIVKKILQNRKATKQ